MNVRISHERVTDGAALPLLIKGCAELARRGLLSHDLPYHFQDKAVCAYSGAEPVGVISWRPTDGGAELWILVGYVLPQFRRRGIYRQLWEALVQHARTIGAVRIGSATNLANEEMRAFLRATGRKETSVVSVFWLNESAAVPTGSGNVPGVTA
jgi:GNAT superfamily N-acetyltransferase